MSEEIQYQKTCKMKREKERIAVNSCANAEVVENAMEIVKKGRKREEKDFHCRRRVLKSIQMVIQ